MPRYSKNKQNVGDKGIQTTKSKTTSTKHKQKVKYSKSAEKIKSVDKADGSKKQVIKNNPNYGGKKTVSKTSASGERSFKVKGKSPVEMKSPMELRGADLNVPGEQMEYIDKSEGAPTKMKKSPYTMYGQEMSPAQMQGRSPLAKYGISKRL